MADTYTFVPGELANRASTKLQLGLVDTGDTVNGQPVYALRVDGGTSFPMLAPDGTRSAPSYSFANDPDTGLSRISTNRIALTAPDGWGDFVGITVDGASINVQIYPSIEMQNFSASNRSAISGVREGNNLRWLDMPVRRTDATVDAVFVHSRLAMSSQNTPTAGFGLGVSYQLKSSTTEDVDASQVDTSWVTATHASRTARWRVKTVYNAGALADTIGAQRTGVAGSTGLWLFDEDNATLEQVTVGGADSGGAGFKVLRIPN